MKLYDNTERKQKKKKRNCRQLCINGNFSFSSLFTRTSNSKRRRGKKRATRFEAFQRSVFLVRLLLLINSVDAQIKRPV